jgi:hypothetical protein
MGKIRREAAPPASEAELTKTAIAGGGAAPTTVSSRELDRP